MADNSKHDGDSSSSVSRRRFVTAAGAAGVTTGLAGCANFVGGGSDGGDGGDGGGDGGDGGSTGDGGSGGTTTVKWSFDPNAAQNAGEEIKAAFHNEGGLSDDIEIELIQRGTGTGSVRANYNRLLSAGETDPDMFLMDNGWTNIFIQRGQIENLSQNMLTDEQVSTISDEFFTGFTDTARDPSSGDLYGVPFFPDFPVMNYRKDLAEEAGYDPEGENWATEPMRWDEWSQVVADIKDQSDVEYGFTTQWDIYVGTACCTFNEVMSSWGGAYFGGRDNLFGPVGERPITVNEPETIRSLNMMRKFVHGEEFGGELENYAGNIAPTEILGWTEETSRAPFAEGNAVAHRNWPYSLRLNGADPSETEDPALGEALGAMPIPYAVSESEAAQPGTGGTTSALGGWHITVNPNSEQKDAVQQVIAAAMKRETQLKLLEVWGWLPVRPESFNSDQAQNIEPIGRYMDTLRVAGENVMPRPTTTVWSSQTSKIATQANRAVAQEVSSQEAMNTLYDQLEQTEQA
ncbi:extracellular solute-binding protein [Haloarcula litorea]|uniref:extracellular solute-binding protein n=1 Tax=Haloarcula litorea TaxID=3032579 RepID=UPI0023E7F653|nr:extracellular solute-binding protein [Halomicroarcula sp. GDY20]